MDTVKIDVRTADNLFGLFMSSVQNVCFSAISDHNKDIVQVLYCISINFVFLDSSTEGPPVKFGQSSDFSVLPDDKFWKNL